MEPDSEPSSHNPVHDRRTYASLRPLTHPLPVSLPTFFDPLLSDAPVGFISERRYEPPTDGAETDLRE